MFRALTRSAPLCAGAVVFAVMIARVIYGATLSDSALIGMIPDDAFYYIQMARHRVTSGFWTFDGTAPTTGFHLLYGYLLVFVYSVLPDIGWRQLFVLIGVYSSVLIAVSAYYISRATESMFDRRLVPIAIAPFFTPVVMQQSTAMMEAGTLICLTGLTVFAIARQKSLKIRWLPVLILLGFAGSLTRSDYGLLPGVLFVALFCAALWMDNWTHLKSAFLVTVGAVLGVLAIAFHSYLISGEMVQASAQTKYYWSVLSGHPVGPAITLAASVGLPLFDSVGRLPKVVYMAVAGVPVAWSLWRLIWFGEPLPKSPGVAMFLGCLLTIAGYVLFYRQNSQGLLPWYSANFVAPTGIVLASVVWVMFQYRASTAALLGGALFLSTGLATGYTIQSKHQAGMMQAGLFLKDRAGTDVYAGWNAGVISYFSGKPLVNLDGLANNEVYPYLRENRLLDYLKQRKVRYILDYASMIEEPYARRRGGYDDARVDKCIHAVRTVDEGAPSWWGARMTLFEIRPGCL